ncbi:hypothetical protein ACFKHW_07055 [Bradyrhizobium lupini]|uniref:hypothetical protein n=1 Tax=Rhizobium lupini TaxID=136996 RepID=UPI0036710D7C
MVIFTIAGAVLVLLEVAAALLKDKDKKLLPLGGSQSSQMGIIFGLAFAFHELFGVLR